MSRGGEGREESAFSQLNDSRQPCEKGKKQHRLIKSLDLRSLVTQSHSRSGRLGDIEKWNATRSNLGSRIHLPRMANDAFPHPGRAEEKREGGVLEWAGGGD